MAQGAEEGLEDDRVQRLDQQSGVVHNVSKRQREMEGAGVSFLGLQPLAMKTE